MILEKEIDGLLYSLDTDEQEATVEKCVDKKRTGEVVPPESFFHEGIVYRVTSIGESAFSCCSNLTTITIPESVRNIGWHACLNCFSLASLIIPANVTSIGYGAFNNCLNLTTIIVDDKNIIYDSRNKCNAIIETNSNTLIIGCSTTIIPEGVTSIGDEAFHYHSDLSSIYIPQGVTEIGQSTFYGCKNLININIPESLTSIGHFAFSKCLGLTKIKIPEGVKSIGDGTFACCCNLTRVNIPQRAKSIGMFAFAGCSNLTEITIPKSMTSIGECAFIECKLLKSIIIPKSVTDIEEASFQRSGITYLTILGKPTIGINAFDECEKLTDVYCYSEETPQAEYAFDYFNLSRITLHVPESAIEAYKNTEPWCRFGTIVAIK